MIFLGSLQQEALAEVFRQSDVFALPSFFEGLPLVTMEAMACGCIVVGTNTGFVLDIGKNEENMMISEPGNLKQMRENIDIILNNKDLRNNIIENAIKTVEKLNWNNSCAQLEKILKTTCKIEERR